MELGLKGKVAVVTGGSKGIGHAAAVQFLREGAKVAVCARGAAELEQAAAALKGLGEVYYEPVDATDREAVFAFAAHARERLGGLDCWVNNVGAPGPKASERYTPAEIDQVARINFHSAVYGCEAAFSYMKQTGGSIVNVSSLAARCATAGRSTLYAPMKAAVVSLAATLAGEYAAYGVRVNAVLPGFTVTPAVRATVPPGELERNAREALLGRLAEPEEIAGPIVFLCGTPAGYITGASLEISGGRGIVLNPAYSYERKAGEQAGAVSASPA